MQVFMSLLFLLKKESNALTSLSLVHYFKFKRMNITHKLGEEEVGYSIIFYYLKYYSYLIYHILGLSTIPWN